MGLERAFDKVILEEHYTSLYGPSILAKQDKAPAEPQTKPLKYTESTNLKAWNSAVASTPWSKYQNKLDDDVTADDNHLQVLLENRRQRAKTMENKILMTK